MLFLMAYPVAVLTEIVLPDGGAGGGENVTVGSAVYPEPWSDKLTDTTLPTTIGVKFAPAPVGDAIESPGAVIWLDSPATADAGMSLINEMLPTPAVVILIGLIKFVGDDANASAWVV